MDDNLKILKDKQGKILFVGSMRQIKRRFKKIFRAGPLPWLQFQLKQEGYSIKRALLPKNLKGYNKDMDKLKQKLKDIPKEPGVYQFKNKDGEVIYVEWVNILLATTTDRSSPT
jgi:hypothetical protein